MIIALVETGTMPEAFCRALMSGVCTGKAAVTSSGLGLGLSSSQPVLGRFSLANCHFMTMDKDVSYRQIRNGMDKASRHQRTEPDQLAMLTAL